MSKIFQIITFANQKQPAMFEKGMISDRQGAASPLGGCTAIFLTRKRPLVASRRGRLLD
jgi:hypothetical protein